ncbi:MAG: hypothetical protein LH614_15270 [Pyrinomonadaceae bacterium]|nr:hypothetical protein [Pyrinomonadaceae bacterium]
MKLKFFLTVAFVLLSGTLTYSQTPFEYGKPAELKGLSKIFVDTGADIKNHERIIQEIEKEKFFVVVEKPEDAEIFLVFRGNKEKVITGTTTRPIYGTNSTSTTVNEEKRSTGSGMVLIKGKDKDRQRIIMDFESTKDTLIEKKPATKFAKEFILDF